MPEIQSRDALDSLPPKRALCAWYAFATGVLEARQNPTVCRPSCECPAMSVYKERESSHEWQARKVSSDAAKSLRERKPGGELSAGMSEKSGEKKEKRK